MSYQQDNNDFKKSSNEFMSNKDRTLLSWFLIITGVLNIVFLFLSIK